MEQVLRKRLSLRHTSLLELMQKAEDLMRKSEEGGVTLQEITQVQLKLENTAVMFEKETLKLVECCNESDEETQERLMQDQMKAEDLIAELKTLKSLCSNKEEESAISSKLPKLEIPKFDGDILKWPEFWDKFDTNIHQRKLSNVDKLSYLFGALAGPALDTLRGIDITNENYKLALDMLNERFGDKGLVIDSHYDALTKLPKATGNFRSTLDSIRKHLRILETLGEDTKGNFFRNLVCSKFPDQVKYELNLLAPKERSTDIILQTLDKIITAREQSGTLPSTSSGFSAGPSSSTEVLHVKNMASAQRKRKMGTHNEQTHKRGRLECAFCKGNHFSDRCNTYKTYAQRVKQLKNRCYRCFQIGHAVKGCLSKKRCFYCQGAHNQALCTQKIPKELHKGAPRKKDSVQCQIEKSTRNKPQGNVLEHMEQKDISNCLPVNAKSFLQTATAQIQHNNRSVPVRLLLDSGSQRSYLTSRLAQTLNLQPDQDDQLLIYTFGSDQPQETTSPSVDITLVTKRGCERSIRVNIVPHITDRVPISYLNVSEEIDVPADDDSLSERIDLLIGNDYYFSFFRNKFFKIKENLYLVDTDLGWIVSGSLSDDSGNDLSIITYCQCHGSDCPYFSEPDLPLRNVDMKFLWSLESIGIVDSPKATREEEAVKYFNKTVTYNNGRYEVKWPWIQFPPELPTNFGLAFGRLRSLIRRADKETLTSYEEILSEQLKAGIIELVEPQVPQNKQVSPPVHYLPHHIVKQSGKKGRIVYDASARTREEKSLNECMYRGPSLLEDLTALLLKFRTGKIGITADVEKAFLQISLQEEDRDVTRFLWVKNNSEPTEDNLLHYRFCRVPFGIIASPFLLTATIRHHLSNTNEILLKKIADRCYVDNLVTEAKSQHEASELYHETRKAFEELSMNIRDWVSNDKDFLESIPEKHKAKERDQVKVLGLIWDLNKDMLHIKGPNLAELNAPENKTTKKDVLKTLARLYDPCGFASPLILPAKMLFQDTCVMKLKWNTPLPPELQQSWSTALESLDAAKEIKIPRYIGHAMVDSENVTHELHCFTDASKNAYAAVVYIILRGTSNAVTSFLMSKSRITPIEDKNDLKIPRLELLGFLIGSRLLKYVAENLGIHIDKKYLWTDSLIVLAWMKSNKLLPPFVSRRVNEIKLNKEVELRYIPTQMNPADIATRPGAIKQKAQLWFNGPEFLTKAEQEWPVQQYDEQQILCSAGEALDTIDGPEMAVKGYEDLTYVSEELNDHIEEVHIPETLSSIIDVEAIVIRDLQAKFYPEEVAGKKTSLARNLDLFLDSNGILRCKGRLANTDWTYDAKYPILVPKEGEFTKKLIIETHEQNYHVGVSHTLSLIRQKYWIPQGRAQVQKVLKRCPQCIKHGGGPYKLPPTPALPPERVNLTTPFSFTGMDYFGPVFVQKSGEKEKRWVCLFTCLAVRAIHLEVVHDLTAEECLMGIRRFIASRGKPNLIVSDNATQFKITSEILADPYCVKNGIRWKFIPQLAPWHGGVYERLIALVKSCLKRTLEKHLLQDGQMLTVIKEVEAVVNTRPLVRVGSEVEHVLRPVDFLSLGKCVEITVSQEPRLDGTATKIDLLNSWRRGQAILNEFKDMFHRQYLPSLRERYRQDPKQPRVTATRTPHIGDIVQIRGDSKNRNNWKVGKISALIQGPDGECRIAKVKVGEHELTRSVGHLYPLEAEVGRGEIESVEAASEKPLTSHLDKDRTPNPVLKIDSPEVMEEMEVDIPDIREVNEAPPDFNGDHEGTPDISECVDAPIVAKEAEMDVVDIQPNAVNEGNSTTRARREAAIRAREKIAEWTRHLLAIL